MLQDFYLDLRRKHQTQDSTPITTRQLESLIRLTEVLGTIILLYHKSMEKTMVTKVIYFYALKIISRFQFFLEIGP